MVRADEKPNLREASCCKVEVRNGGKGWRLAGLLSRLSTLKTWPFNAAAIAVDVPASLNANFSRRLPSTLDKAAWNSVPWEVVNTPSIVQYSCGRKASISSSRSQMIRKATDCTRPAEREPGSLRHNTGESVKPTKSSSARRAKYASTSAVSNARGL